MPLAGGFSSVLQDLDPVIHGPSGFIGTVAASHCPPHRLSSLSVGSPNNLCLPAFLPTMCVLLGFPHTVLLPTHPALWEGSEGGL